MEPEPELEMERERAERLNRKPPGPVAPEQERTRELEQVLPERLAVS